MKKEVSVNNQMSNTDKPLRLRGKLIKHIEPEQFDEVELPDPESRVIRTALKHLKCAIEDAKVRYGGCEEDLPLINRLLGEDVGEPEPKPKPEPEFKKIEPLEFNDFTFDIARLHPGGWMFETNLQKVLNTMRSQLGIITDHLNKLTAKVMGEE